MHNSTYAQRRWVFPLPGLPKARTFSHLPKNEPSSNALTCPLILLPVVKKNALLIRNTPTYNNAIAIVSPWEARNCLRFHPSQRESAAGWQNRTHTIFGKDGRSMKPRFCFLQNRDMCRSLTTGPREISVWLK